LLSNFIQASLSYPKDENFDLGKMFEKQTHCSKNYGATKFLFFDIGQCGIYFENNVLTNLFFKCLLYIFFICLFQYLFDFKIFYADGSWRGMRFWSWLDWEKSLNCLSLRELVLKQFCLWRLTCVFPIPHNQRKNKCKSIIEKYIWFIVGIPSL